MIQWYILDENHRPVPAEMLEAAKAFENHGSIAFDQVTPDTYVSTIFLAFDHSFGRPGRSPQLFETMVFGGPLEHRQWRYSTYEEALAGHKAALDAVLDASGIAR
jgi:hypothetical protein